VVGTPRRRCLRGVDDGAAVDDGGVGPRPARPNDPADLSRGRSSAEPTARRSGMTATTPPMCKARKRVAHSHRSTEARGMPGGEACAARGGEPAGAPTPRGGGCPPASNSASAPAARGESPRPRVAGSLCSLVCLRISRQGEAHRDRGCPVQAASLHAAVLWGDRQTCEDLTAGWSKTEMS